MNEGKRLPDLLDGKSVPYFFQKLVDAIGRQERSGEASVILNQLEGDFARFEVALARRAGDHPQTAQSIAAVRRTLDQLRRYFSDRPCDDRSDDAQFDLVRDLRDRWTELRDQADQIDTH